MFEKIIIRRNSDFVDIIDPGAMFESMLFYDTVHIVFDTSSLLQLSKIIGLESLTELLKNKLIVGTLFWDYFACINNNNGGLSCSNLVAIQARGESGKKRPNDLEHLVALLERQFGKSRETRKSANAILDLVPVKNLKKNNNLEEILASARLDLQDKSYLRAAVKFVLDDLVPEYQLPPNWVFEVIPYQGEFIINTNLNFGVINSFHNKKPLFSDDKIGTGHILVAILNARADMFFCADYMAEYMSTEIASNLMKLKVSDLIKRRSLSSKEIENFQEITLPNSKTIREVMNSGERSVPEFLKLLDNAKKFKCEFLKIANPDEGLIREYQAALTRETWADKLPSKIKRMSIFAGAGLIGEAFLPTGVSAVAGVGLTMIDDILVDRLFKGWRPNQFINGPLKAFVGEK